VVNLALSTPNSADFFSWTSQTQLRKSWEGLECQLTQCAASASHRPAYAWMGPLLFWFLKLLALIVLVVILGVLVRRVWVWFSLWLGQVSRDCAVKRVEPVRSRSDWLAIAQEAQANQDYHRAFEALYRALLVQLHEAGVLRQDAARTDREYILGLDQLWSLGDKPLHLREDWVMLFRTHESLCFGGEVLQQGHFNQCRAAYDSLAPYLEVSAGL
jgi:hypothetical protein